MSEFVYCWLMSFNYEEAVDNFVSMGLDIPDRKEYESYIEKRDKEMYIWLNKVTGTDEKK